MRNKQAEEESEKYGRASEYEEKNDSWNSNSTYEKKVAATVYTHIHRISSVMCVRYSGNMCLLVEYKKRRRRI